MMATEQKKKTTRAKRSKATESKKTASRKSTGKKRIVKKKVFSKAPEGKHFILKNGVRLDHYVELAQVLSTVEQDVIDHHVSEIHNHFSAWIADVFDEPELAKLLANERDRSKIQVIIYKYLVQKYLH
jgi:hypothetical protein